MRNVKLLTQARFAKQGDTFGAVALPHTWNALDGQDGGNDYWRGVGIYELDLPDPAPGTRQYIEFQGANHVATVYCNGRELGIHKGGFSTFRYELTGAMKKEGNVLSVVVTNADSEVYPQKADFTFYGGLYRDVNFIEVKKAHFDLLKDGTSGVFVTPMHTGNTRIDLFTTDAVGCTVQVELKDAQGKVVARKKAPAEAHTIVKVGVRNPHLWDGMADPYCYTCTATLLKGETVLDTVTETYGYRSFSVSPQTGFWLNGKNVPLHGVSRHQDKLDKGWAISKEDHKIDLELIKEVGANTIRLAHYQHDQYFYDLCDHAGFALWAEIPFISQFMAGKGAYDNTVSQMTELIAQNYNHPSIFFWGISNEILIGGDREDLTQNLRDLHALAKKMDPSRMTTMAQVSITPTDSEHVYITDVQSYNNYYGWYSGDVAENGPWMDAFHAQNPDVCLGISEYGAENILKWHSTTPVNHDYTEEYASYYHHEMLKAFATRPYLWSTHVWNMFDFAADARDEGGVVGRNNKGLVTYDRLTRKDAFFIYKAYWTTDPMVHVCGERFVDRGPEQRTVTVYTNCDAVTLVVNGKDVETRQAVDHAAVFENVALVDGGNTVTAYCGETKGNTITLNAVAEPNPAYVLPKPEKEAGNWFQMPELPDDTTIEEVDGCFSVYDVVKEILEHPEACTAFTEAFAYLHMEMLVDALNGGAAAILAGSPVTAIAPLMFKDNADKILAHVNRYLIKVKKD